MGVTPAGFRNQTMLADNSMNILRNLGQWNTPLPTASPGTCVKGAVSAETSFEGVILIGLFAKPIPEGAPLYGTLLSSLGNFCFENVKPGTYYLMATSVAWGMQAADVLLPYSTMRFRAKSPIVVSSGSSVPFQQVKLYSPRLDDPPILISLPLLMNQFLNRMSGSAAAADTDKVLY
ncbi:hypothetical protein PACILC2_31840 [Paenibacillus cisolokensis]|uniref:Carboxypeptidase regulatory-like domain-containing protein n=1 Tax=Paenibacillus cisolokensis TaxID=1658519 RepID=A0ABQ4N8W3_9BACL|nr:hypothetical protein PACILC2_31840 [Paenibacillus cisolokensis]